MNSKWRWKMDIMNTADAICDHYFKAPLLVNSDFFCVIDSLNQQIRSYKYAIN